MTGGRHFTGDVVLCRIGGALDLRARSVLSRRSELHREGAIENAEADSDVEAHGR